MEKLKVKEKTKEKELPYKQSICKILCDIIPKELGEELKLVEGATDEVGADVFLRNL